MTLRPIDATERRARLAARHCLAPDFHAKDAVEAATGMVCLHGTDPATVYLSAWARVDDFQVSDLDRALYVDRSLVKHLAMRRTVFVFPRHVLPLAQAGASNRVAAVQRRSVAKDVEAAGLHTDGEQWLTEACAHVLDALSGGREATSTELRKEIPHIDSAIDYGTGKSWAGKVAFAPRVLTVLSASGKVVRASNNGAWRISRPSWATTESWLGAEIEPCTEDDGVRGLVELWLRRFGPGTEADIKWWLGSTLKAVRAALAELHAVEVDLGGRTGYLMPDDVDEAPPSNRGVRCCRRSTRRRWAGSSATGISVRTSRRCSTPTGTPDPPRGGTGGSSEPGGRTTTVPSPSTCSRTSAQRVRRFWNRKPPVSNDWLGGVRVMPRFPTPLAKELSQGGGLRSSNALGTVPHAESPQRRHFPLARGVQRIRAVVDLAVPRRHVSAFEDDQSGVVDQCRVVPRGSAVRDARRCRTG